MEISVGKTIERIKLQEHDNEVKLREKRELNNTLLSLNRAIRDTSTHIGKLTKEYENLILSTDKLSHQLLIEKTKYDALVDQVNSSCKELEELRDKTNDGVSAVWNKRSNLLDTIQGMADKCDIWALLIKPTCNEAEPCLKLVQSSEDEPECNNSKLGNVIERRNKAIAERNYLLSEPEVGEEFIRIKNALQYSMEIAANVVTNA